MYDVYKYYDSNSRFEDENEDFSDYAERYYSHGDTITYTRLIKKKIASNLQNHRLSSYHNCSICDNCDNYREEDDSLYSRVKSNEFRSYPNLKETDVKLAQNYSLTKAPNGYNNTINSFSNNSSYQLTDLIKKAPQQVETVKLDEREIKRTVNFNPKDTSINNEDHGIKKIKDMLKYKLASSFY